MVKFNEKTTLTLSGNGGYGKITFDAVKGNCCIMTPMGNRDFDLEGIIKIRDELNEFIEESTKASEKKSQ